MRLSFGDVLEGEKPVFVEVSTCWVSTATEEKRVLMVDDVWGYALRVEL